jgi:hypothetical protein
VNRYAETHYKFRLPWSPLHRRLPEMIVDAPWMAAPGRAAPLFLCVHDAHRFPVTLRAVRVVVRAGGEMQKAEKTFDLRLDQPFHWIDLPWPGPETPGENLVDVLFEIETPKGRRRKFVNHNLPGLAPQSLSVLRMTQPLPFPEGWTSGDLHCHTSWSEDPVEWGGDPIVMRRAADCQNLGFWAATDHSYDFAWQHPDWLVPTDPAARFRDFRASLPVDEPGRSVVLPAEEVSCGNRDGRNVHLLVIDHPEYLPGQGDGGRRGLHNRPDLSIGQVLAETARSGAPAFAAHPKPGIGLVQRLLFRRGDWDHADLLPHLHGLQFWNGKVGDDFRQGRALWVADLLRGNRRLPIAGNDAHGDLNRATQVSRPLFQLHQTRSHRFGHARTWIHLDSEPSRESIRAALAGDTPTVLSDGPYLSLRVGGAAQAEERSSSGIELRAASPVEFGKIRAVRVYAHLRGSAKEDLLLNATPDAQDWSHRMDLPSGALYLRAEAETSKGHRALTRAVEPG